MNNSSSELYEKVAERCSSYTQDESAAINSTSYDSKSCTTCSHFDRDRYCNLDLYDQIVSQNDLQ